MNEHSPETEAIRNPKCDPEKILEWASQLAGESEQDPKLERGYIETDAYACLCQKLLTLNSQLIAITGEQGVGKSTTLHRLYWEANRRGVPTILSRMADPFELFKMLHFDPFLLTTYQEPFVRTLQETPYSTYTRRLFADLKKRQNYLPRAARNLSSSSDLLNVDSAEKVLGRTTLEQLRWQIWYEMLVKSRNILIDLPDYSASDKRRVSKDMDRVHQLWLAFKNSGALNNIVIAIQNDYAHTHHFLDKMETIELKPLTSTQLRNSYINRFNSSYPFSEDSLTRLAELSLGNARRFKRILTSVVEFWRSKQDPQLPIDFEMITSTVSVDRLIRELKLQKLFPRQPKFASKAAQLILELSEHGPQHQSDLGRKLDLRPYEVTRMLENLPYVGQRQDGKRKLLTLGTPGGS